jgi:hypothetical protein
LEFLWDGLRNIDDVLFRLYEGDPSKAVQERAKEFFQLAFRQQTEQKQGVRDFHKPAAKEGGIKRQRYSKRKQLVVASIANALQQLKIPHQWSTKRMSVELLKKSKKKTEKISLGSLSLSLFLFLLLTFILISHAHTEISDCLDGIEVSGTSVNKVFSDLDVKFRAPEDNSVSLVPEKEQAQSSFRTVDDIRREQQARGITRKRPIDIFQRSNPPKRQKVLVNGMYITVNEAKKIEMENQQRQKSTAGVAASSSKANANASPQTNGVTLSEIVGRSLSSESSVASVASSNDAETPQSHTPHTQPHSTSVHSELGSSDEVTGISSSPSTMSATLEPELVQIITNGEHHDAGATSSLSSTFPMALTVDQ